MNYFIGSLVNCWGFNQVPVLWSHCRLKNLPYSFTKLNQMTAMWLSENQVRSHVLCINHKYKGVTEGVFLRHCNCSGVHDDIQR